MLHVDRLRAVALAAVAGALLMPALAVAHPLGNFTINHYSGVRITAGGVVVDHVIDMAEIPTFSAFREVDTDGDGVASDPERATAALARCTDQASALAFTVGGAPVSLSVAASTVSFPTGQGAPTMRLVCRLTGSVPAGVAGAVTFADPTFAERAGWREIVIQGDAMTVAGDVAAVGRSERLTAYPTGLLAQASAVSAVAFSVSAGGPALAPLVQPEFDASAAGEAATSGSAGSAGSGAPAAVPGGIAELGGDIAGVFQAQELTPWVLVLSMIAAAGLGALHALSPGHGKTVMAAYLVGSRGTARQALGLGTTVTVSHTLGVLALGALSLSASAIIPPERLYPILGVVSGAIVIVIAGWLLLSMGRRWWAARAARLVAAAAHDHGHAPDHDHGYDPDHAHDQGHAHPHVAHAAARDHADHAHDHPPAEPAADDPGDHAPEAHADPHTNDHGHAPEPDGWHSHGGVRHTHVPQGDGPLRWRALFALGLAGGMVPSVSAIILLLGSIAAGRPAYGIALTIAFGIGMAIVLVGIGVGLVYARGLLERMPRRALGASLSRFVPAGSATVMLVAGLLITAQAAVTLR